MSQEGGRRRQGLNHRHRLAHAPSGRYARAPELTISIAESMPAQDQEPHRSAKGETREEPSPPATRHVDERLTRRRVDFGGIFRYARSSPKVVGLGGRGPAAWLVGGRASGGLVVVVGAGLGAVFEVDPWRFARGRHTSRHPCSLRGRCRMPSWAQDHRGCSPADGRQTR